MNSDVTKNANGKGAESPLLMTTGRNFFRRTNFSSSDLHQDPGKLSSCQYYYVSFKWNSKNLLISPWRSFREIADTTVSEPALHWGI